MADDLTELLIAHGEGDPEALPRLVPVVYEDLRRIARQQLARLRPGNTLDTTALVNEAYVKLVDSSRVAARDRGHFFAIAATAMRQILVDHVRRRTSQKRGGESAPISLGRVEVGVDAQAELLLAIDAALEQLARVDPRLARVFECRFFLGLGEQEAADALGVSLRTLQRDWRMARAWLRESLDDGSG
ncbi:MAG: RNA polymerase subunit sigma-70 [Acidobacteria bacterium]|nr:MAG: RNA polymerase subunit sigma-70 [Acidobacteriota bacterium]REK00842.1 MAG: RNA polymerase subunit sigma-70 [Acidobacteriota bacterium]